MGFKKRRALLATLLALSPFRLLAQQTDEDKLFDEESSEERFFKLEEDAVTIASKHAQSTREAPASVTVLTAEDINRYGFRNMGDLLRSVAGWFISDGHDFVYAGVRGILFKGDQNSRILVQIDGHTMNEAWSSSSSIDEALGIELSAVSRVEVLQGPSSTLYGTNAFLGIVNIVTKSAAEASRVGAELVLGSYGDTRLSASSAMKLKDFQYSLRLSLEGASGRSLYFPERRDTSPSAGFTAPAADALTAGHAYLKLQFKDLQFMALYADRLKHVPTAPFDTVLNDPRTYYEQKRWFIEAKFNHSLSPKVDLMARAYYDGYQFQDHLLTNDADPEVEPYLFRDLGTANWAGGELQLGLTLADSAKFSDHLYLGAEADSISTLSQSYSAISLDNDSPDRDENPVKIPQNALNVGAYLQNELQIAQSVNLVLGARYDYNSNFFANTAISQSLSPRGALIIKTKSDSTFKLVYSQGFRNPSIYEAYFTDGTDILENHQLTPETIRNFELDYDYRFKKTFRLGVAVYYFQATNLLRQQEVCVDPASGTATPGPSSTCPDDSFEQFRNVAEVDGLGSELTALAALPMGVQARGTLAVQKATEALEDSTISQVLSNSPVVVGNLMASVPLLRDRAFLSGQLHVVGPQVAGTDVAGTVTRLPAYALANLVFTARDLVKGLDFTAGVYNAFDQQYRTVAVSEKIVVDRSDEQLLAIPADGRTFALKLSYRY